MTLASAITSPTTGCGWEHFGPTGTVYFPNFILDQYYCLPSGSASSHEHILRATAGERATNRSFAPQHGTAQGYQGVAGIELDYIYIHSGYR